MMLVHGLSRRRGKKETNLMLMSLDITSFVTMRPEAKLVVNIFSEKLRLFFLPSFMMHGKLLDHHLPSLPLLMMTLLDASYV